MAKKWGETWTRTRFLALSLLLSTPAWGGAYVELGLGAASPTILDVLQAGWYAEVGGGYVKHTDTATARLGLALSGSRHPRFDYGWDFNIADGALPVLVAPPPGGWNQRSLTGRIAVLGLPSPRLGLGAHFELGVGDTHLDEQEDSGSSAVQEVFPLAGSAGLLLEWALTDRYYLGLSQGLTFGSASLRYGGGHILSLQLHWETG